MLFNNLQLPNINNVDVRDSIFDYCVTGMLVNFVNGSNVHYIIQTLAGNYLHSGGAAGAVPVMGFKENLHF